jgi:hypothetical protein
MGLGTSSWAETTEPKRGSRIKSDFIVTVLSMFCGAKGCRYEDTVRGMLTLVDEVGTGQY